MRVWGAAQKIVAGHLKQQAAGKTEEIQLQGHSEVQASQFFLLFGLLLDFLKRFQL